MSVEGGEFSKRLSSFIGHDSHGYAGPPKSHIVIFTMAYVFFGLVVCMMRLGCYQQWPLFMKKAVVHSWDHHTGWMGRKRDGTWVELDGVEVHDAFSKATKDDGTDKVEVTVPKSVHFTTVTVEAVDVENDKDLERGPDNQGVQGSARNEHQDAHANCPSVRQMRKSGLLVVGLAMFLLLAFWPVQVIWVLVWWAIYQVWATHYIYISTRRSRAVGRAHSDTTARGHVDSQASKPVIVVQKTAFVMESPGRDAQLEENSGGRNTTTVTAGHRETNNPWSTAMTDAGFNNFFPPAGKISRKVKAFLEHEPFLPAPEFCRRKMLYAEKKRRDRLDSAVTRLLVLQQYHQQVMICMDAHRMVAESEESIQRSGSFITEMTKANHMSRESMAVSAKHNSRVR
ncbi:hypothetical protein V8F06_002831 [Rhypophila decipiens]